VDWQFIRGLLILLVVVGIILIASALLYEPGGISRQMPSPKRPNR